MSARASLALVFAALTFACSSLTLGACGAPEHGDPLSGARTALAEGSPKRALAAVANAEDGPGLVLRLRALIATSQWGDVERLLVKVPTGPEHGALACLFAAERQDVTATRLCEAVKELVYDDAVLGDEVQAALADSYEREHRPDAAEATLTALVAARPTRPNRKAQVDFYERQGFVREAVAAAEAWLAVEPADPTLKVRLGQLLERKAKGDLLDKRYPDAEAAARRLLELVPARQVARYHLADALEAQGKVDEAKAERARAKAAGVEPPPAVDTFPGMPERPHDHDHDHP